MKVDRSYLVGYIKTNVNNFSINIFDRQSNFNCFIDRKRM